MHDWLRRRSAAVVLVGFALAFLALQAVFGWYAYLVDQADHGFAPSASEYALQFLDRVFENLQSEAWQVVLAAWVFKHFFYEGAPDSKEPEEEVA
ncbi:MAG: hypothetical protein M3R38_12845 [Actinomycetota bacterium]|nr:hypothetical protein [Actinomycetota bacterium]